MSKKISELNSVTEANDEDILLLNQDDETVTISKGNLLANIVERYDNIIGAEEYSNQETYSKGEYCIYENRLKVCNTDITTPEEYNSSKWDDTTLIELPTEDFKDKVTFSEDVTVNIDNIEFIKKGNVVYIRYQGQSTTHQGGNNGTLLFTVPSEYAPQNGTCFTPFIQSNNTYGIVRITGAGECRINTISSTSNSGRIYFNTFYTV